MKKSLNTLQDFIFFCKKVELSHIMLNIKHPDCYYILEDDTIVCIKNICSKSKNREELFAVVGIYSTLSPYYDNPIDSRILGFFLAEEIPIAEKVIPVGYLKQKCISIPIENNVVLMISIL